MEEVDCKAYLSTEGLVNILRLMKTISAKLDESGFIDRTFVAAGVK